MNDDTRARLRELLRQHEGLKLKPYQCTAGRWTIGYGHNLEAHNAAWPVSITQEEAEKYLDQDMAAAEKHCQMQIPFFNGLDDVRKAVLIDMCFNLGISGLSGFRKTLTAISGKQYKTAAIEMLNSKWAVQVGKRAIRLSDMMATGKWI